MKWKVKRLSWVSIGFFCLSLFSACYHPPYNDFKPYNRSYIDVLAGSVAGALVGSVVGFPGPGTAVGATVVTGVGLMHDRKKKLIQQIQKADIQYEKDGDTMTLIIPTDRYFLFNTARLNQLCYPALSRVVKLLSFYPDSPIYIGGFTDDLGDRKDKQRLSQAQAETFLTFLWANGVSSSRLHAEGYGARYAVSSNRIVHGSAQNRRIEVQWFINPLPANRTVPYIGPAK